MKIKYVIIDETLPILFSDGNLHAHLAAVGNVTSAGFCSFFKGDGASENADWNVACWGESISLGIKSTPQWDEVLIRKMLEQN